MSCLSCTKDGVIDLSNCDHVACVRYLIDNPEDYKKFLIPEPRFNYDRIRDLLLRRYTHVDLRNEQNLSRLVDMLKMAATRRDFCFFNSISPIIHYRLNSRDRDDLILVKKIIDSESRPTCL
jgi:hypothetical protein